MIWELPFGASVGPSIRADGDRLVASTSRMAALATLGLYLKTVIVDRGSRTVTVRTRRAWGFVRETVIPFEQVSSVTYGYEDGNPMAHVTAAHDSVDRFVVGLRVPGQDEVALFSFVGEGTFVRSGDLPDWWSWEDSVFDVIGAQARESRVFAQLLCQTIGVTLTPSTLTSG